MRSDGGGMDREEIFAVLDGYEQLSAHVAELRFDALTTPERLAVLERLERIARRAPVPGHQLINHIRAQSSEAELGGALSHALADRLRISRAEASRRIGEAAELGPRTTMGGQPLQPVLAATAGAQRAGAIGAEHVRVIRGFLRQLPDALDAPTRERAERDLARLGTEFRPDQVKKAAERLAMVLNPDGRYRDADRARRRAVLVGPQHPDGMSPISGWLTPELRAGLEAVFAKWAAPGMCDPADETATIDGQPSEQRAARDRRSRAQRQHDALTALTRAMLACGQLGSHRGLPVSLIVTTTLRELTAAAGAGVTGGGSLLPIADVIRLARHAIHYLAIFDDTGRPLWLGQAKRCASKEQRIVLHATDRGCTFPGCDVPGYECQAHHVDDWAHTHRTDIDDLTFGCHTHHALISDGGWKTRKRPDGRTEWIPPPHLDTGQPRTNTYHHPEELLKPEEGEEN